MRSRLVRMAVFCAGVSLAGAAQQTPKVSLETSETLFSVLAAINACGYNQELASSNPIRSKVRAELARAAEGSAEAAGARDKLCLFYRDHRQSDPGRDLAQYISLALNLGAPPQFPTLIHQADLPPDAGYVLGLPPLLKTYYQQLGVHAIWQAHQREYEQLVDQFHDPVSRMILETEVYLKQPLGGFVGRKFAVLVEPMGAPGQVNARNYGSDYFVVVAPEDGALRMNEIRHAYLHYVLDPLAEKRGTTLKSLDPLLNVVQSAPMDGNYKNDITLLVTESLVRAIEARTLAYGKAPEAERRLAVQTAMEEGYVLTQYFYDQLAAFEKTPDSLRNAYPDFLHNIELDREKKRAKAIAFRAQAAPEVVRASKGRPTYPLETAEERLQQGDLNGARDLATEALRDPGQDQSRALFILARAATLSRDMTGAKSYFERTLQVAREPRMVAWSHIYLGRIFDLQENRDEAVKHYQAALAAGDAQADTQAAAQRGLQQPYEPPAAARSTPGGNSESQTGDTNK